jgi:hypothetical protein
MTLTELKQHIRLQLDELSESNWEDTDLDTYLVLAVNNFLNKTNVGRVRQTITLDGSATYDLTYRPIHVKGSMWLIGVGNHRTFYSIAWEDWNRYDETEKEDLRVYFLDRIGKKIHLSTNLTGSFYIEYVRGGTKDDLELIIDGNSSTDPLIEEEYQEHIITYVLSKALERDRLFNEAQYFRNQYSKAVKDVKQEYDQRNPSGLRDDWDMSNYNVHRSENDFLQREHLR